MQDNVSDSGVTTPDKHGFDNQNPDFSGINDWKDLPEPWRSYDFIFQEIENENNPRNKLFKLVQVPDDFSDLQGRVFDEQGKNKFTQKYDVDYWVQWVYLNGRVDDYAPAGVEIGGDYKEGGDINRPKLDDFKDVEVYDKKRNEVDNYE